MKVKALSLLLATLVLGAIAVEAQDVQSVKAWILGSSIGDDVQVTLHDGEFLEGTLAETEGERFGIWVDPDVASRERYPGIRSMKRWVAYADVADLSVAGMSVGSSEGSLAYRLRIGDEARIQTSDGATLKGKIQDFDGETIRIKDQALSLGEGDVLKIDLQESDSVTNGALIGFGIGAGLVGLACLQGCYAEYAALGVLVYGGAGAGLGALFDGLNKNYTTIYVDSEDRKKFTIAPLLTPDKKGVVVSFSF